MAGRTRFSRSLAALVGGLVLVVTLLAPASGRAGATAVPPVTGVAADLTRTLATTAPGARIAAYAWGTSAADAAAAVRAEGLPVLYTFRRLDTVATIGTPAALRRLIGTGRLRYVERARPVSYDTSVTGTAATRVTDAEALFTGVDGHQLDGTGVGIGIVDSGAVGDHPFYMDDAGNNRLVRNMKNACAITFASIDPSGTVPDCMGDHDTVDELFIDATGIDTDSGVGGGHGSHVTGIAGGRKMLTAIGEPVRGVATNASLYMVGGGAGLFVIAPLAGLDWMLEHHADPCFDRTPKPTAAQCPPIRVVNASFGEPGTYDPNGIEERMSAAIVGDGVVMVYAAGNGDTTDTGAQPGGDGTDSRTSNTCQDPTLGVICVANYDDAEVGARDGKLDPSSSRGQIGKPETFPDVSAPGHEILSSCAAGAAICRGTYTADLEFGSISGTSMAAPHVAGVVALLLQHRPDLTPQQVELLLENTAHKFRSQGAYVEDRASATSSAGDADALRNPDGNLTSFDNGHGLVDLAAAIASLDGVVDPGPAPLACPASPSFADPAGDAAVLLYAPAGTVAPAVDLLGTTLRWDADAHELVAVLRVAGDPDAIGVGNGQRYRVGMRIDGTVVSLYGIRLLNELATANTDVRRFTVAPGVAANYGTRNTSGAFDSAAKTVTIRLSPATFAAAFPTAAPLGPGSVIDSVASETYVDNYTGTAGGDTSSTQCGFTVAEAGAPVAAVPELPLGALALVVALVGGALVVRRRRTLG